jgi:dethiobiotin synthetase
VAARLEGIEVRLDAILAAARALQARHAALLVEGAGGLLVPLTPRETYADLAVALGLPVLVVARAGLGTVNHTALTLEALQARGLAVAGVILNLTGVPVLATLPFCADIAGREAILRSALRGKVQFS